MDHSPQTSPPIFEELRVGGLIFAAQEPFDLPGVGHRIDLGTGRFPVDAGQGVLHGLDYLVVSHGGPGGHVEDQLDVPLGKSLSDFHDQVAFRGPDPVLYAEQFFISAVRGAVLSPVLTDHEDDVVGLRACDCMGESLDVEGVDGPVVGLGRVVDKGLVVEHQTES